MLRNWYNLLILLMITVVLLSCHHVETGLDRVHEYSDLFRHKRLGIITNQTAYDRNDRFIVNKFLQMEDVEISALFGPEHGIRGSYAAGEKIDGADSVMNEIPVYSLYGRHLKPTPDMLSEVDVLVYDIQDIGARFYTYIWTMALAMEAAAENSIPFVVLDRPNPLTGEGVEGNVLDTTFATFVGLYPIPVRHGMTVGELAHMFNNEGWLKSDREAELKVIPLKGWNRSYWYNETGLEFRKPSPNMPDLATATVYPGICLLEGSNVSEGRGTLQPFRQIGAPWVNSRELVSRLNALGLPGVEFHVHAFTPLALEGMAPNPKYKEAVCSGARVVLTDRTVYKPYLTGIHIVNVLYHLYPDSFSWRVTHFDRLCGTDRIRKGIINGVDPELLKEQWQEELDRFVKMRRKYLIY